MVDLNNISEKTTSEAHSLETLQLILILKMNQLTDPRGLKQPYASLICIHLSLLSTSSVCF